MSWTNAILLVMLGLAGQTPCGQEPAYQDMNSFRPDLLVVRSVSGKAMYEKKVLVDLCVALFSDPDHKLVAWTKTDQQGGFSLGGVRPGRYRLVASGGLFCPANVPLRVAKWPEGGLFRTRKLVIHMEAIAIDNCSWIEAR